MKRITYELLFPLTLVIVLASSCAEVSNEDSFVWECKLDMPQESINAQVLLCEERCFSDDDIMSFISFLTGDKSSLYSRYQYSKEEWEARIAEINAEKDSPAYSEDYAAYLNNQLNAANDTIENVSTLINELAKNELSTVYVKNENERIHVLQFIRNENFFSYVREDDITIVGDRMCQYNLIHGDADDKAYLQWALPLTAEIDKTSALEIALNCVDKMDMQLELFFSEPCTIVTNCVNRSYGWRFTFTKRIDQRSAQFWDGQWYYISPDCYPVTAAPWEQEFCVITVDASGICALNWQGATIETGKSTATLFDDTTLLKVKMQDVIISVFAGNLADIESQLVFRVMQASLGTAMILDETGEQGEYIPAWYLDVQYKNDSDPDEESNWENETVIFNAISGEYIEPRVTARKLDQIKSLTDGK